MNLLKVNVITQLEFELTYFKATVQHASYYTTGTLPLDKSSLSSCQAASTDIPGPLSPFLPIIPRFWQVLRTTSRILTELLYVGFSWSPCFCEGVHRKTSLMSSSLLL